MGKKIKVKLKKCFYPGCGRKSTKVGCEDHIKIAARRITINWYRKRRGQEPLSMQDFLNEYDALKVRRASSVVNRTDMLRDSRPGDVEFDGQSPPCEKCWARDEDKNRRGCVYCDARARYAVAVAGGPPPREGWGSMVAYGR